jgi:hypothetical protein
MLARLEQATRIARRAAGLLVLVAGPAIPGPLRLDGHAAQQRQGLEESSRRPDADASSRELLERTHREEGEAILALADDAMAGKPVPTDFVVRWHNDVVKAQRGTFVPFTLTIDSARLSRPGALVYVRARRRGMDGTSARARDGKPGERDDAYPVDAIFPVELKPVAGQPVRISRGFAVQPGEYDVFVVMRERLEPDGSRSHPKAAVIRQPISVPDFRLGELTTSSVMVADRLTPLPEAVPADQLAERPYAVGRHEITPAADRRFGRDEELIVVFLVYNPMVTTERQFDVKVEYHFFRKVGAGALPEPGVDRPTHSLARPGERYFNHTDPQRLNTALMGSAFDPHSGEPLMAGQVVPLADFQDGEYRLELQVLDLLSGKSVSRDVLFTVGS